MQYPFSIKSFGVNSLVAAIMGLMVPRGGQSPLSPSEGTVDSVTLHSIWNCELLSFLEPVLLAMFPTILGTKKKIFLFHIKPSVLKTANPKMFFTGQIK